MCGPAWLRACIIDLGWLLLAVSSKANEDERFIENRHDGSVLSCLSDTRKIEVLPDVTFIHPPWSRDGDGYPFWATRKRSGLPNWLTFGWPAELKSRMPGNQRLNYWILRFFRVG